MDFLRRTSSFLVPGRQSTTTPPKSSPYSSPYETPSPQSTPATASSAPAIPRIGPKTFDEMDIALADGHLNKGMLNRLSRYEDLPQPQSAPRVLALSSYFSRAADTAGKGGRKFLSSRPWLYLPHSSWLPTPRRHTNFLVNGIDHEPKPFFDAVTGKNWAFPYGADPTGEMDYIDAPERFSNGDLVPRLRGSEERVMREGHWLGDREGEWFPGFMWVGRGVTAGEFMAMDG